jgi:MFS family permease
MWGSALNPINSSIIATALVGIGAVFSAIIAGRNWVRGPLIATGLAIIAGGTLLIFITSRSSLVLLIGQSLIFGISTGLGTVGNQTALYAQTPPAEIAVASGLLRTSSYIGAIFASSVITLAFAHSATDSGLHTVAYVFAGMGIIATLAALLDRAIPRKAT